MGSWMPRTISFSHDGRAIVAVLVDDPPAGDWTLVEFCSICNHPLGDHPFYTTDPFLFYVHSDCCYQYATSVTAASDQAQQLSGYQSRSLSGNQSLSLYGDQSFSFYGNQSRSLSGDQSRGISGPFINPYYPSAPCESYSQPYKPYNIPSYYPPAAHHYYNQYQYQPPQTHYYSAGNQTPYHQYNNHQYPSSSSSSSSSHSFTSASGWKKTAAFTVAGPLLQALFSLLFSV